MSIIEEEIYNPEEIVSTRRLPESIEYIKVSSLDESLIRNIHNVTICPIQFKDIVYFATLSINHCIIYSINKENEIKMIQEYVDDNPREEFTCCEWVIIQSETDNLKEMYIAVGGTQSLIKILDCMNQVVSNVLSGHAGTIQGIRSLHQNYMILSGSIDGTIRMWDIRKTTSLQIITLIDYFSILSSFDISINDDDLVCSDRNGAVCTYKYDKSANTYEFDKIVFTGKKAPIYFVGHYLLGIVNNNCSLFIPDTQEIDNCETTSVIKILKQYISIDTPSFFCINKDASILACLINDTVLIYDIDNDIQPTCSFTIQEFNNIPTKLFFYGENNSILVLMNDGSIHLYSQTLSQSTNLSNPQLPCFFMDSDDLLSQPDYLFGLLPQNTIREI